MRTYRPTQETIVAFTEGDCWRLGTRISEITGYPIALVYDNTYGPICGWRHVATKTPKGILDIEGMRSPSAFLSAWVDKLSGSIPEEDLDLGFVKAQRDLIKDVTRGQRVRFLHVSNARLDVVANRLIESYL